MFYYSHSKEAERAAEILKQALLTVEESGTREKKAADSYYLLKKDGSSGCHCRMWIFK